MFVTIQNSTFNINDISYVAPHPVNPHILYVQLISDPQHPHRFPCSDKEEAAKLARKVADQIFSMVSLYGRR